MKQINRFLNTYGTPATVIAIVSIIVVGLNIYSLFV